MALVPWIAQQDVIFDLAKHHPARLRRVPENPGNLHEIAKMCYFYHSLMADSQNSELTERLI